MFAHMPSAIRLQATEMKQPWCTSHGFDRAGVERARREGFNRTPNPLTYWTVRCHNGCSSRLTPGSCLEYLSRIGLTTPTAARGRSSHFRCYNQEMNLQRLPRLRARLVSRGDVVTLPREERQFRSSKRTNVSVFRHTEPPFFRRHFTTATKHETSTYTTVPSIQKPQSESNATDTRTHRQTLTHTKHTCCTTPQEAEPTSLVAGNRSRALKTICNQNTPPCVTSVRLSTISPGVGTNVGPVNSGTMNVADQVWMKQAPLHCHRLRQRYGVSFASRTVALVLGGTSVRISNSSFSSPFVPRPTSCSTQSVVHAQAGPACKKEDPPRNEHLPKHSL